MVFASEQRKKAAEDHPGVSYSEINKLIGIKWNQLSEEAKKPYIERSKRLKEQHMRDHPDFRYKIKRNYKSGMKRSKNIQKNHSLKRILRSLEPQVAAYDSKNRNLITNSLAQYETPFSTAIRFPASMSSYQSTSYTPLSQNNVPFESIKCSLGLVKDYASRMV
ncbi:Transcription factor SOX-14, partial [Stegodyphus mimosarum]